MEHNGYNYRYSLVIG